MKIEKISIDKIKMYENNAKEHPEWQVEQIKKSIQEFGFNDPIAIDEKGVGNKALHVSVMSSEQLYEAFCFPLDRIYIPAVKSNIFYGNIFISNKFGMSDISNLLRSVIHYWSTFLFKTSSTKTLRLTAS